MDRPDLTVAEEAAERHRPDVALVDIGLPGIDGIECYAAALGIEAAAQAFNQEGDFKYGEIYVNVIDLKGNWVIYPPKPAAVAPIST